MYNALAIDWLQLTVKLPRRDFENIFDSKYYTVIRTDVPGEGVKDIDYRKAKEIDRLNQRYKLERTGVQTRNFKAIFEIKDRKTGEDIAVLAAEPRSLMCMTEDMGLIKIINKQLYQKNFSRFVRDLLKDLQLQFLNITRLDLAYDFLRFDTMECQTFIQHFSQEYFMKKMQCKFKMMGDTPSVDKGQRTGGISSLKFGLETSDVNYYLYNKTLELAQVKDKPWIREHWQSNGWNGKDNVWRLEFSLHPDNKGIQKLAVDQDGVIFVEKTYHFKDLDLLDHIDDVYKFYFDRHFNFVITEKTKKGNFKKQSRCEDVKLFNDMVFAGVKIDLSIKKDSSRSTKTFAKKLMEFNQEQRGQDFELAIAGNDAFTFILEKHDLKDWAKRKLQGFDETTLSDRIVKQFAAKKNFDSGCIVTTSQQIKKRIEDVRLIRQQERYDFIVSRFQLIPDGKVPVYNAEGECTGYDDAPF